MTEFKGDKRTKEYKEWKKRYENKPKGLGDVVEKVTKATGIKKVVEAITDDCGCEERKERWNKTVSFGLRMKNPMTEDEYHQIKDFMATKPNTVQPDDQERFKKIYERVFGVQISCTPCSFGKEIWAVLTKVVSI